MDTRKIVLAIAVLAVMASVAVTTVEAAPNGIPEWAVIQEAYSWLGVPYKTDKVGDRSGIDCSWLVYRVYSNAGKPYGAYYNYRTAENIRQASYSVYPPRPGDVIIFVDKTTGKSTHVGIYIKPGPNGYWDSYFIHAEGLRAKKVIEDRLYYSAYYPNGEYYKYFNIYFARYNPDYWVS